MATGRSIGFSGGSINGGRIAVERGESTPVDLKLV